MNIQAVLRKGNDCFSPPYSTLPSDAGQSETSRQRTRVPGTGEFGPCWEGNEGHCGMDVSGRTESCQSPVPALSPCRGVAGEGLGLMDGCLSWEATVAWQDAPLRQRGVGWEETAGTGKVELGEERDVCQGFLFFFFNFLESQTQTNSIDLRSRSG